MKLGFPMSRFCSLGGKIEDLSISDIRTAPWLGFTSVDHHNFNAQLFLFCCAALAGVFIKCLKNMQVFFAISHEPFLNARGGLLNCHP